MRIVSFIAALAALLAFSPVIAAVALAVRIGMGSPVFFRQERSGLGGRRFRMIKFRSMTDARDAEGRLLPDAKRTTATGRFLRRSRLDELPELVNILRGEMAWIGPRPLLPETIAALGEDGARRGRVRPGLTGWAQVSGNALLTNEQKLQLDLWYIDHRSIAIDLRILVLTLWVALCGERVNTHNLERCRAGNAGRSS